MNKKLLITFCFLFLVFLLALLLQKSTSIPNPVQGNTPQPQTQVQLPKIEPKIQEPQPQEETPPEQIISKTYTSYAEALEASKSLKRPIFLYFGADWCAYCRKMKSTTLSDEEVRQKLAKEYVPCFIDTDADRATSRKYKVAGIPAYMVLSQDETVLARSSGMKTKEEFLKWLKPENVSFLEE